MALSQSLRNRAVVVEKFITIPVASATVVGPAVPAGTLVLAAGIEVLAAVSADPTTYTVAASDGTTTFMAATSIKSLAAGAIKAGVTAGLVAAADTVDAVVVVSGTAPATTTAARMWAVIIDVNDCVIPAAEVDRDTLA